MGLEFLISVHYLKDKIINYFGDGKKWGVKIRYIEEHKPLGTAGSLGMIDEYLNKPFFCINADIISKVNYLNLLEDHIHSNLMLLSVLEKINSITLWSSDIK